jgi:hypothetical protein
MRRHDNCPGFVVWVTAFGPIADNGWARFVPQPHIGSACRGRAGRCLAMTQQWWDTHRRTVLVVVSSVETAVWLMDAVPLLAADRRVTTLFTVAPSGGICRATEFLAARRLPILPWRQAIRREFDLVLTADAHGLAQPWGKTLLYPCGGAPVAGVTPDVLALAHGADLPAWSECSPAAVTVVGDLCYDRLIASIPFRTGYRRVFGVTRAQRLVVVESTVDIGHVLDLPPERYRVATPRPESWRAALVAADVVIGGLGPATRYGAAIGLPVLVSAPAEDRPRLDGATELVRLHARRLSAERPLRGQIEAVRRRDRGWQDRVADVVTARSGRAGDLLRAAMYELLDLAEPTRPWPCFPVPAPRLNHYERLLPDTCSPERV